MPEDNVLHNLELSQIYEDKGNGADAKNLEQMLDEENS